MSLDREDQPMSTVTWNKPNFSTGISHSWISEAHAFASNLQRWPDPGSDSEDAAVYLGPSPSQITNRWRLWRMFGPKGQEKPYSNRLEHSNTQPVRPMGSTPSPRVLSFGRASEDGAAIEQLLDEVVTAVPRRFQYLQAPSKR